MAMETEIQIINGVPDEKVDKMVEKIRKNPRYVSHKVISEGNGKSTIEVTLRVDKDRRFLKPKTEKKRNKRRGSS
jgi:seryl-tRNA synthetase